MAITGASSGFGRVASELEAWRSVGEATAMHDA
jgi:hypothetical protein